ncbi:MULTISPECIES: DUF742 domain-containing protein [Kitasatospora]|uniref:DUF742 domain-containing protein n=1 Tax=Kitasatospora griseola TaxID=2064 RepID=A0A0D0Q6U8_KITGR|nr:MULTISPECIES: DUF742 domain-containing protein [Kitasatospora]KIQ66853.1 hypothetical protein TR51_05260 [Kitasatospora griseola]PJN27826.1 DUF742 domain-containing protein [Kitasatospora sp. CB02891]GGQ91891.1 hypothetical protein GCM10010195_54880 [Kitasatospora griseola]
MSNWEEVGPERFFVITRGRDRQHAVTDFDLVTLVVARSRPEPTMQPEHAAILRICGSPLSVAEISAYLSLPNSLVIVLLSELLGTHKIEARAPIPAAALPDLSLLEAVIHGLQRL